jgi:predicted ATPase
LLLLEDLHDFDDASLRLLLLLAQELRDARVMVIATLRVPAALSERQKRVCEALARLSERIELDGLDATSINDYAQAALGQALSEQACQLLLHKTGGIPLFVRAALDGLAHKPSRGLGVDEVRVPDSAKDILLGNLRALSAHTRELIDVASVLGDELDLAERSRCAN